MEEKDAHASHHADFLPFKHWRGAASYINIELLGWREHSDL